ncbi:unnamed protein product [Nippostrongylus brasiliensis]|uniref:Uncharacterized protein n=1 Tax=Nippostrongylus brasiliensis TaxID=27835 RepID=A0A0N4YMP2_NIPBR|nr:hypothetical protein Q1695_000518 [Nippostrongylus brasiliensis]VDL82182.1 unnamed protein product [Nippostrongylus brasiliensis]
MTKKQDRRNAIEIARDGRVIKKTKKLLEKPVNWFATTTRKHRKGEGGRCWRLEEVMMPSKERRWNMLQIEGRDDVNYHVLLSAAYSSFSLSMEICGLQARNVSL